MYEVDRTHSHWATLQPAGLRALKRSNANAVPPGAFPGEWSSPLITTTAFSPRGRYQKRGSGILSAFISVIRFTSSRCCSSACGMSTLPVFSQLE